MMKQIKAFIISLGIMFLAGILGFVGINLALKLYVGHKNEIISPNLLGVNINVARKTCQSNDLYLEEIEYIHNDEVAKDRIIMQEPHPDIMIKKFRTIKVVVSKGPEQVNVPYLDNLALTEAKVRLENAGLRLGKKIYRYSNAVEKGLIIFSQPMADELTAKGSEVEVAISLGKLPSSQANLEKYKNLLDETGE
jgi:serine/threonine-protein kinase